ncbi:type II 3-dehydroquinate dehydratase [bacterium]|nr:type II 3-dehydroquinate dehydratase [bacterium]MBT4291147.1 type II 3-dehydroquinate dehydratase [bacterium]MBT7310182.1 type II 3-dehydroquinate dehydratase [bacterium]
MCWKKSPKLRACNFVRSLSLAIINGPNLNKLGKRESNHYGSFTYNELTDYCNQQAASLGIEIDIYQNDIEGELVQLIHELSEKVDGIILNAAAYTHTSVAIRDAVLTVNIPVVEVHISNPYAREEFRRKNLLSDIVIASISGFGITSYKLAIDGIFSILEDKNR